MVKKPKKKNKKSIYVFRKTNHAIDKEELENCSSYFHVNELSKSTSENEFNGTNESTISRNFDDLQNSLR